MDSGSKLFVMTDDQMDKLVKQCAENASAATIKAMREENKNSARKVRDKRLHNTELLLRNYNMFKMSVAQSVFAVRQLEKEQSASEILHLMMGNEADDLTLESIKRSKVKTAVILRHIDTMLDLYEVYCSRSRDELDKRRYDVLVDRYIAEPPLSVKDIADKYMISKESVYTDLKVAKERVSALIFGIDGVGLYYKNQ